MPAIHSVKFLGKEGGEINSRVCGHAKIIPVEQSQVISGGVAAMVSLGVKQLCVLSAFSDSSCGMMPKLL